MKFSMGRRLLGEFLGTAFLLLVIVASSFHLASFDQSASLVQLLGHALAVGLGLAVLILIFAPVSGAHFNPALSLVMMVSGRLPFYEFPLYVTAQMLGALVGVLLGEMMFVSFVGFEVTQLTVTSGIMRSGVGDLLSEGVFTYMFILLLLAVMYNSPSFLCWAAGLYVAVAIMSSPSGAFLNPAVTLARVFTSSAAGISPASVTSYVVIEFAAALLAGGTFVSLFSERKSR